jgi:hypothetical protein
MTETGATIDHQLTTINHRPSAISLQPSVIGHRPSAIRVEKGRNNMNRSVRSSLRGRREQRGRRRGITLPLIATALVSVCGFVALAVDVGRVAVARVQVQTAADVAAMAGARALNGSLPQDTSAATSTAISAAGSIPVLGQTLTASNLTTTHGTYRYNSATQTFTPAYSLNPGELYNLTQASVSVSCPTTFAQALGFGSFNVTATGTAAHRPRDVAIVLDYSGSMNNESDLWNNEAYLDNGQSAPNNTNNTSNNAETVYPLFGHYTNQKNYSDYAHYANLLSPTADSSNALTGNSAIGKSNVSVSALGIPAMVNDFWQNARGATGVGAFTQVPDTSLDAYNQAGGDKYLRKSGNNSGQPYAATVADVTGSTSVNTSFESNGYKQYTGTASNGYILGPRYWGKSFFIWPPDPTNDWRQLYLGTNDNTKLWDANGNWLDPPGNHTINYKAVLAWISATPGVFPPTLRSGNTLFYSAIPTDVPAASYDHTVLNSTITNPDQRFWKEYIDYVFGVYRDPNGNVQHPQTPTCSVGPDFTFGTVQISSPPGGGQYMNYADNPQRPRHRFWFGPMTMIQYMSDTGILPGTTHDISMYPMKTGMGGALQDIQVNHPNDLVSMVLFSRPQYNNDAAGTGAFNLAQYSLTTNYQAIINSLWVPPNSGSADVRPWDPNGAQTPRAHGDYDSNTASSYGFMLAYNELSSSSALSALEQAGTTGVGGLGRVGAQRLVIYETDGMANEDSIPGGTFVNSVSGSSNNSYYPIQPGDVVNGGGYNQNSLLQVVQNICNNIDGSAVTLSGYTPYSSNQNYPGFSTPGKPVQVQTIAFGAIFEVPGSTQNSSVSLLSQIAAIGGTVFPSSPSDPTNGYKWCTGTITQRETKLRQAFMNIMNGGIPISLIQ